jgi:Furin-like cysteine rich region
MVCLVEYQFYTVTYFFCCAVCPSECGHSGCYKDLRTLEKKCCNSKCLGGCRGSRESDCIACANVSYNGVCRSDCPVGTYKVSAGMLEILMDDKI